MKSLKTTGKRTNTAISEALNARINTQQNNQWSEQLLNFQGISDIPEFESYRQELIESKNESSS